jgi:ATP-dependent DNA helicase RecG
MHGQDEVSPHACKVQTEVRTTWSLRYSAATYNDTVPPATGTPLDQPVASQPGVGRERVEQLARLKLRTVGDVLYQQPRRYEDRRHLLPIKKLSKDEPQLCRGTVVTLGTKRYRRGQRSVFECVLDDGTARLHLRWWNMSYMENYFKVDDEVLAYGKIASLKPRTMDHPETEVFSDADEARIHLNRIVPIYPLTEGLSQRAMRHIAWRVVEEFAESLDDPKHAAPGMPTRAVAIRQLHFPGEIEETEIARQRLALDEFVEFQSDIDQRRRKLQKNARARDCTGNGKLTDPFKMSLGFTMTDAQQKVIGEITSDLGGRFPMRRLLQGDVGSGKTVVAAAAIIMALENGFNTLLMAPTEILAEQHGRTFRQWLEPLGVSVALQTGSRHEINMEAPLFDSEDKPILVVGTHALFQSSFKLENIGLVVIDEQHKFGVEQRNELLRKGDYPHLLVMTATPIPRTLGLTLYGDLDISVIDEMPAGRGIIRTHARTSERWPKIIEFIKTKLGEGRQAYIVYPRVEHGEDNVKAVTREAHKLQRAFSTHEVGVLHGRLKSREKEAVMTDFREGRIHVLLATTVIEVGVDVPNASIMLVENAEAYGLAQLHQLRGRIGRGSEDAHFIMVTGKDSPEANERLKILVETTDGFEVAEADLRMRGPGELLGQDQSGLPPFRFGNLRRDLGLIRMARDLVIKGS